VLGVDRVQAGHDLAFPNLIPFLEGGLEEPAADLGAKPDLGRLDVPRGVDRAAVVALPATNGCQGGGRDDDDDHE